MEQDPRSIYRTNIPSVREEDDETPPDYLDFASLSAFKECSDDPDFRGTSFYLLDQMCLAQIGFGKIANRSADGKSCNVVLYHPVNYPEGSTIEIRWSTDAYNTYNVQTLMDDMTCRRVDCRGGTGDGSTFYLTLPIESSYQQTVYDDVEGYIRTDGPEVSSTAILNSGTGFFDWYSLNDPLNVFPANDTEVFVKPVVAPPDMSYHEGIEAGDAIEDDSTTFLSTKRALYGTGKLRTKFIPWRHYQIDFLVYAHGIVNDEDDEGSIIVDFGGGSTQTYDILYQTACPGELSVITVVLSYDDYGVMLDWYQIIDDRVPGLYAIGCTGEEQRITGCFWEPEDDTVIICESLVNGQYKTIPVAITTPTSGYGIDSTGPRPPFIQSGETTAETLTPFHLKAARIRYRRRDDALNNITPAITAETCGECATYCDICDRDIPAAAFKMTPRNVRRSANVVSWYLGFAWPTWTAMDGYWVLGSTQIDFDYTNANLATDTVTAIQAALGTMYSGVTFSVSVVSLDGNDDGGITITITATSVNSIEPSDLGISGGTLPIYSGSAVIRYQPAIELACVNNHEFVLYHLNFNPGGGCKYGDMVGDYCMKSGAPFTGTILEISEGETYNELSLIIYDTVGASQASWTENLTAVGTSVACTNLSMSLDNDGIVTADTAGFNYGIATIDIESYPLQTTPTGGQDITTLPYFDQYLERLRCEWCGECGEIAQELDVVISGTDIPFRKWEVGYDPDVPTGWPTWNCNTTLRLRQSAKWCLGDGHGCYWQIEFKGPFQSGNGGLYIDNPGGDWDGTYVSSFGVFLADGHSLGDGYAGFDIQPGGTTRSTRYFWFSQPYFTLDSGTGNRTYYSNSTCLGTWAGADYRSDAGWVSNLVQFGYAGGVPGYDDGYYDLLGNEWVVYHNELGNWVGPCITITEAE
jgi:hypothetical protein